MRLPTSSPDGSAAFTLAWYAVLLLVVFTIAFWLGRLTGPDLGGADTDGPPTTPHSGSHP